MNADVVSRRVFLRGAVAAGSVAALELTKPGRLWAAQPPASPVAVERCETYELVDVAKCLSTILDQLGGLGRLVMGKTVAVNVNMTGNARVKFAGLPANRTYQVHPSVVQALVMLVDRAGARRIRVLQGIGSAVPMNEYLGAAGWDIKALQTLNAAVEFENTRNLGTGRQYVRVTVPWGGSLYPAYYLNHSYPECDVYFSVAKLKNHRTAGITLSMKNNFGITPLALYGQSKQDEASTESRVEMFHEGSIRPPQGLPEEVDPTAPKRATNRVPRVIVDMVGIRPIDFAIIDGIETVSGGEGPWFEGLRLQKPRLLIAGRNAVCTDAVACACMGYDATASAGTGVFPGENHLALAAQQNLGTHNLKEIEVRGLAIAEALHPFGWEPKTRNF